MCLFFGCRTQSQPGCYEFSGSEQRKPTILAPIQAQLQLITILRQRIEPPVVGGSRVEALFPGWRPSLSTSRGVGNSGGPESECDAEPPGSLLPSVPNTQKSVKGFAPSTPLDRHRNGSAEPDRNREMPPPAASAALGKRSQGSLGLHRLQSPRTAERRSKAADLSRDKVDSNL